jgi:hypothetical protein
VNNLTKSRDRVLARVEEMRDHCVVFPTRKEALAWEEVFDGADVSGDIRLYPPFDQVLARCREVRESTLALLDSLSEDALDKASAEVPAGFEDTFESYRLCLQYVADHWYMHRGQLADARRAAGLERMWV